MRKIKTNDEIIVITGKDKGKRGTVTRLVGENKVVVSGINIVKDTPSRTRTPGSRVVLLRKKRRWIFPMSRSSIRRPIRQIVLAFR